MIKLVAVFERVEGKVKGGVQLRRDGETDAEMIELGEALQSAMSLCLQYYQRHYLQRESIESAEYLRAIAADIADNLPRGNQIE